MDGFRKAAIAKQVAHEMDAYRAARERGDVAAAWLSLERAHIIGQTYFVLHLAAHGHMLGYAIARGDLREAGGQVLRLLLVPLGSLTGRLPAGNNGRARVNPFAPMPMPPDLAGPVRAGTTGHVDIELRP